MPITTDEMVQLIHLKRSAIVRTRLFDATEAARLAFLAFVWGGRDWSDR